MDRADAIALFSAISYRRLRCCCCCMGNWIYYYGQREEWQRQSQWSSIKIGLLCSGLAWECARNYSWWKCATIIYFFLIAAPRIKLFKIARRWLTWTMDSSPADFFFFFFFIHSLIMPIRLLLQRPLLYTARKKNLLICIFMWCI